MGKYISLLFVSSLALLLSFPLPAMAEETFTIEAARRSTTITGFTRARASMKLSALVTDRIISVEADVGDTIDKNGIFARFDSTLTELDLESIRTNQEKLRSKIAYLEKEVSRFRTLLESHATAQSQLDSLEQELSQVRLALQATQSEERKLEEILNRHTVKAPAGWQVIARHIEPGEWIAAGTPLADLGDYRTLVVPFAISQEEYLNLQEKQDNLSLLLPERKLQVKARLIRVSPGFDPVTRKLNLELQITSKMENSRGGIRAELALDLLDPGGSLLVPESAIGSRYDASWLTTPSGDKVAVIVLGPGPDPATLRVSASSVNPGDTFLLKSIGE